MWRILFVVQEILAVTNNTFFFQKCTFLGGKGYDVKAVYDLVKDVCQGEAVIPLNKRNTKNRRSSLLAISSVMHAMSCTGMENV